MEPFIRRWGVPILVDVLSTFPSPTPSTPVTTVLDSKLHALWLAATSSPWAAAGLMFVLLLTMVRVVHALAHPRHNHDPVRRFSRTDKAIILSRAGGRCEHHGWITGRCRRTERLEADHVHPHSRGGQTAVVNGQALCRRHNQAKRATIPFNWQLRSLERHRAGYFPAGVPRTLIRRVGRTSAAPRTTANPHPASLKWAGSADHPTVEPMRQLTRFEP
jgi:HNH endonuclease